MSRVLRLSSQLLAKWVLSGDSVRTELSERTLISDAEMFACSVCREVCVLARVVNDHVAREAGFVFSSS